MQLPAGMCVLDRYIVDSLLGRGGMGEVYKGHHDRLGLPVALKILTETTPDLIKRFEREARLMARVRHPNIVSILDFGVLPNGLPCIAMEFIEGEELGKRIAARGALPWREAVEIQRGILSGLEAMHNAQLLHRDLKPGNIVIQPGTPEIAKIIDFGIAKPSGDDGHTQLTSAGAMVGTPAYMPPEQILGYTIDERSDLYAAGLILNELLTGHLPFPGRDISSVMRRLRQQPEPPVAPAHLPGIPSGFANLMRSALDPDPGGRPPSARAFIQAMDAAATTALAPPAPPPQANIDALQTFHPGTAPALPPTALQRPLGQAYAPPPAGLAQQPIDSQHLQIGHGTQVTTYPSPQTGTYAPAPNAYATGVPGMAAETRRYLVVARLPPSRLAHPEERRWLGGVVSPLGRAYTLGAQFWFALQSVPCVPADAARSGKAVVAEIHARYGAAARADCRLVDGSFTLTPAQISGASPLPEVFTQLLNEVSK